MRQRPYGGGAYLTLTIVLLTVLTLVGVSHMVARAGSSPGTATYGQPPAEVSADPQVRVVVNLQNDQLHPRQLAYDAKRNGLWFWTSTRDANRTFENRVYFYSISARRLRSWPIYSGDWSSQLLAGLVVAPNGDVWIGWNHNLIVFHPADGTFERYGLPAHPRYPLPPAVIGDLPADLGVADLAAGPDGTIWIARYGALSLTAFNPANHSFTEYPLPASTGDPAKLAIGPDGHVFFVTDLSADHPGHGMESIGEYDPKAGTTLVYAQGAGSIVMTAGGDLYAALGGYGFGLMRLGAARESASIRHTVATFEHRVIPIDVDDSALAADNRGRIWVAVAGQPKIAVYDPVSGQLAEYQYAARTIGSLHYATLPSWATGPANPDAVVLSRVAAMTTDGQAHLWYIRVGSDRIEEVTA